MRPYYRLDPEPPTEPPDTPDREYTCPICGGFAREIFFDNRLDIFGCDICVKSDNIDDVLDIPETQPIPTCRYCDAEEQTVYIDRSGKIKACFKCVTIKPAEEAFA